MKIFKKILPIILVLALSYWSIKPLLNSGFFPIHDDTQVARVQQMHKALTDGMFPVRWAADLGYGYGYPIFNFYAPLAYYIGAVFMLIGFNALIATKLMIGTGVVLAGVFMYFLAREFWGKMGGILSAILYVYAPYHALNIYVRGAIAELWAYGILPLTFFSVYKLFSTVQSVANLETKSKIKNQRSKINIRIWLWVCVSALSYAAIIVSHNLTAMMVTPFLFVFASFLYIKNRFGTNTYKPHYILLGILVGMLLSAFYSLPVLAEMKYTDVLSVVGGGSDYKDHFVCAGQLWNSEWAFGGSVPGCTDGLSFKIGKLHILLGLISLLALIPLRKKEKTKLQISIMFLIFLIISVFLTLKESKFIWDAIAHMSFFQFPWRFLVIISFLISFMGGAVLSLFEKRILMLEAIQHRVLFLVKAASCTVIIILIIFVNVDVFVPQKFIDKSAEDYTGKLELNWRVSKISDEYMPSGFFKPLRETDVPRSRFESKEKIKILFIKEKTQEINAKLDAPSKATVFVNLAYFPGWHVYLDHKQVWFKYSGQGIIIDIPKGIHEIDIKYSQTPIQKTGNAVSIAGVIMLLAGIISHRKKI